MYIRRKVIKGHTYYYLVEGTRRGRKVKQRVVQYLGKHPWGYLSSSGGGGTPHVFRGFENVTTSVLDKLHASPAST